MLSGNDFDAVCVSVAQRSQTPRDSGAESLFHFVLNGIGKIAKEVNARAFFQLIDTDSVLRHVLTAIVGIGYLVGPDTYGVVSAVVQAEQGHEEVAWHDETIAQSAIHFVVTAVLTFVYGAALAYIKGVASGCDDTHFLLQFGP